MRRAEQLLPLAAAGVLILLLAGCVPDEVPVTPRVQTKVIDATTHLPIEGATVTAWADGTPDRESSAKTDAQGLVTVPVLHRTVWMPPIPRDWIFPNGHVRFDANGYQTLELDTLDVLQAFLVENRPVELTRSSTK